MVLVGVGNACVKRDFMLPVMIKHDEGIKGTKTNQFHPLFRVKIDIHPPPLEIRKNNENNGVKVGKIPKMIVLCQKTRYFGI